MIVNRPVSDGELKPAKTCGGEAHRTGGQRKFAMVYLFITGLFRGWGTLERTGGEIRCRCVRLAFAFAGRAPAAVGHQHMLYVTNVTWSDVPLATAAVRIAATGIVNEDGGRLLISGR